MVRGSAHLWWAVPAPTGRTGQRSAFQAVPALLCDQRYGLYRETRSAFSGQCCPETGLLFAQPSRRTSVRARRRSGAPELGPASVRLAALHPEWRQRRLLHHRRRGIIAPGTIETRSTNRFVVPDAESDLRARGPTKHVLRHLVASNLGDVCRRIVVPDFVTVHRILHLVSICIYSGPRPLDLPGGGRRVRHWVAWLAQVALARHEPLRAADVPRPVVIGDVGVGFRANTGVNVVLRPA